MINRLVKDIFFGKKAFQPLFRKLFFISLEGLNIGTGGGNLRFSGEQCAIRHALKNVERPVVFDVGAQGGEYFSEVLDMTAGKAEIHAFEPNSKDFTTLKGTFGNKVTIINSALGEANGEANLYFPEGISGLSSFHGGDKRFTKSEKVKIETIDSYCHINKIGKIDLLKLDVEGHEFACLKGANKMLPNIRFIQFEMGIASRDARLYFKDIFELLSDYKISRILKDGLEEVKSSDKISELLFTTNYLAERK
jgi:FkbM family methyltransferase